MQFKDYQMPLIMWLPCFWSVAHSTKYILFFLPSVSMPLYGFPFAWWFSAVWEDLLTGSERRECNKCKTQVLCKIRLPCIEVWLTLMTFIIFYHIYHFIIIFILGPYCFRSKHFSVHIGHTFNVFSHSRQWHRCFEWKERDHRSFAIENRKSGFRCLNPSPHPQLHPAAVH